MNQSFDAFASLLEPAAQVDPNASPPTTTTMPERSGIVTFLPSSPSSSSLDSCVELEMVPSYPAVAPPPSPSPSRNVSASVMTMRSRAAWRAALLEAKAVAEGTLPATFGKDHAVVARRLGPPPTIPEHSLPLEHEDSLTKIFFSPNSEDEALAGRKPGKRASTSNRSPLTTTETSDNASSLPAPRSPPSAARMRNISLRSARRRSAARRASRVLSASAAANVNTSAQSPPPDTPPSSPRSSKHLSPHPQHPLRTMLSVPREERTVSSPLSSPPSTPSTLSLASRSPSPCASNMSADVNRLGGYPELSFYRRSLILRASEKNPPKVTFTKKDTDDSSSETEALEKEEEKAKDDEVNNSEKPKPEKSAEEEKRVTAPRPPKKKSPRRRKRKSPEIPSDEQAMRDEISYLRTEYLPKLLAEAEAGSVSKSGSGHKSGVKRYAGARPRDALLLRAGLLPAHLSPWRRSLQAQLRRRQEDRRRSDRSLSISRVSGSIPQASIPVCLKGVAPDSSLTSTASKEPSPVRLNVQLLEKATSSLEKPQSTAGMFLKPPRSVSHWSNYSANEMELSVTPPSPVTDVNSMAVSPSSTGRGVSVTYSHLPRLFDPALTTVLRKRSSELVLETKRVPPPTREQTQSRRWLTLLSTAGIQRRAAEEQRRRRSGEGAHEMWARRARLHPRPLVGAIFDRKPFFGAPGPNCNPLPWLN